MAAPYIHTPATDRGDATTLSATHLHPLDFSFAQPFGSPSKDPAQNLRDHMKGMRNHNNKNNKNMQTPRIRHALVDRSRAHAPNGMLGAGKHEFTPLLKSAQRNRVLLRGIEEEEKENNGLGRSGAGNVPETPAAFRSSYASEGGTQLPGQLNSSIASIMEDEEYTGSSGGRRGVGPTPGVESSSMLSSTPIPTIRGGGGTAVLDQGNVLTLRDQEAKLDQIQKDNFGLKLKIHFLEEALRKTGTAFQQATLKENVELKTDKMTLEQELKGQRKRLQDAAHELEEYRDRYEEYLRWVRKRRESQAGEDEEVERLQRLAEESQKIADERERELDEVRRQLDDVERAQVLGGDQEAERLRDDVQDLEAEIRERDRQIEERDERLEGLQEQLQEARGGGEEEVKNLREDVEELESELKEKGEEIDRKNAKILELEERVNSAYDREKSTKKLRGDVAELEARVREKEEALDESGEQMRALEKQLQAAESGHSIRRREQQEEIEALQQKLHSLESAHAAALRQRDERLQEMKMEFESAASAQASKLRQRDDELRNVQRELADKDGEITALQERLQTARGSWDADARETDARLQEKDQVIQEREARLREKSRVIEERDDELADLQKRLRAAEAQHDETGRAQSQQMRTQDEQIRDLQEKMRAAAAGTQAKLQEKDGLIRAREAEMKTLQSRIDTLQTGEKGQLRQKMERIRELETALKQQEQVAKEQLQQNTSLQARLGAMETPSKKDGLLAQQAEQLRLLQQRVHQIEQEKDSELDELDRQLQELETENAALHTTIRDLRQHVEKAERDHSLLGHRDDEVRRQQSQVDALEAEVEQLRSALQQAVEQRQIEVRHLEREMDILRENGKTKMDETQRRLTTEHEAACQDLQDEILVLEAGLDEVEAHKTKLEERVRELEAAKDHSTPVREYDGLRQKLHALEAERAELRSRVEGLERDLLAAKTSARDAEVRSARLRSRVETLEVDLADERTIADERMDLHARLKRASIEAEELRIQLSAAEGREAERKGSSSGHARREAELRAQLREAKLELERVQIDVAEKDARVRVLMGTERELRARMEDNDNDDGMAAQLVEAETRVRELKRQVQVSTRREAELRREIQQLQQPQKKADGEAMAKRHAGELRGLAKQIQCLRARCTREEVFRRDLIHTKHFFVKQVQMYHQWYVSSYRSPTTPLCIPC